MRSVYHEFAMVLSDVRPGQQFVRIDLTTGRCDKGCFISGPMYIATGGKMAEVEINGRVTTMRLEEMGITSLSRSFASWSTLYVTVAPEYAHIPATPPSAEAKK